MTSSGMHSRAWLLFGVMSVVWGIPYLFIKLAVEDLSPSFIAFSRVCIAFAVLVPYAWHRGALRGLRRHWRALALYSAIEISLPWPLIGWGEQRVSSSLTAILIATVPLVMAVIAIRVDPEERPDRARLTGLLVGFAGVVVLLGVDVAGNARELVGAAAILVAAVCYAIGPMIIKHRLSQLDPIGPVTASMAISAVILAPFAAAAPPTQAPSAQAIMAVVVLAIVCGAVAFLCFFALIQEVGPSRASVITYVNPAVAVAVGVAILGESIGPGAIAGLLLILAGSWVSTGGRMPPWRRARVPAIRGTSVPEAQAPPAR